MDQNGLAALSQQQTLTALPDIKIILELICKGGCLSETLTTLVEYIEANNPESICSILLLDDQNRLKHGAAPQLSEDYIKAIDGTKIGPNEGSCGAAVYRNEQVIAADIATDPLWKNYKDLALKHGLRACWSTPIRSSTGTVLGTFGVYHRRPCQPEEFHKLQLEQAVYLAAIAIEHAQYEENLQKSELESHQLRLQLSEAIESLTEGFALYDSEDRLIMCNSKYRELYSGISDQLVPGRRFEDLIRASAYRGMIADAKGRIEEWVRERLRQHQNPQCSYRQQLGNGQWLLISEQKTINGGIVGVRTDITRQVQYEEELRSSISMIESIRKLLSQYITDSDPERIFEDLLRTILETSGSKVGFIGEVEQDEAGRNCLKTRALMKEFWADETRLFDFEEVPPELDHLNLDDLLKRLMVTGDALLSNRPVEDSWVNHLLRNCFAEKVYSFLILPIYSQCELIGIVGVANRPAGYHPKLVEFLKPVLVTGGTLLRAYRNELTREKHENALRVSEERFSKIFHLHPLAKVIIYTNTANIIDANEAFLKLTEFTHAQIIGKSLNEVDLLPDPEYWNDLLHLIQIEGRVSDLESNLRTKSGGVRIVQCSAFQVATFEEPLLFLMFKDVTEQRLANEQNRQLQIQLHHSQKMKAIGQLAAGVAHEFNNILVGINMNAELVLENLETQIPEDLHGPLQDIHKSGELAAELVRQLLAFGRKKEPNTSWVDLNRLISDQRSILQRIVGSKITINLELDPQTKPAWADEAEVEQALMNLVVNARDAMPEGGTLFIGTQNSEFPQDRDNGELNQLPGEYSQLSVRDNGSGMSPETVDQIFEPFFTTKSAGKGTGLGLSTVFRDISNAGGYITVNSQLGEGTEFCIYLSQTQRKTDRIKVDEDPTILADAEPGNGEIILVCDDEALVLTAVASMVEASGYSVIRATGPEEAIQIAMSYTDKISMLITDFNMPGMNGHQLARHLLERDPDLKVIFLTGLADDVPADDDQHQVEVIQKPVKKRVLSQKIRTVLDGCESGTV